VQALGLDLGLLLSQIVNFALMAAILYALLYKPVMARLDERARRIRKGLEDAEHANATRAEAERERGEELARARSESQDIIEQATRAAEQQRQEIIAHAREEAHALVARAQVQAQRERLDATIALHQDMVNLSIAAASRLIARDLDDDGHRALVEQFIREAEDLQ
jgi:F-type H+-transporting ATPase subunit b